MTDISTYEPVLNCTEDMLTLVSWMADNHYNTDIIVHALEKPWKYVPEAIAAYLDIDGADYDELVSQTDDGDTDDLIKRLREFAADMQGDIDLAHGNPGRPE